MADSSLDDFFAKKDRSKKKSKQKTTPSEYVSQPETMTRKTKKRPEKEKQSGSNTTGSQATEEDLEWNDYEQETEKDYSGLRIQNLQIKSDDDDDVENELNQDNNENSEFGEKQESSHQGPWSKQGTQTPPAPSPIPVQVQETPEPAAPEENPKSVGRYVPPSQRGNNSSAASITRTRLAKKTAPNIQSEVDFPTLGGGSGAPNDVEKKYIDRVRNNNRNYEDPSNYSLPLKLNNKFKVLED